MIRLKSFAFPVLLSLLFLNRPALQAQSISADSLLIRAFATDELLPVLIDSAITYSPELRRIGSSEALANANLLISKKAVYSAFALQSSYYYGTNISAVNNPSGTLGGNNFTTAQNSFYNVGVGLQLPFSYILNRKNIIRAGQSQVNMAIAEKENTALFIKQEVIRLYQELKLAHKLMAVSNKNKQAAQINHSMAEKDFLKGQVTVDDLSRVLDFYNKSIIEYETYVNRFQTSYMQLEAYTGINLSTLITRVK